jgi:hypothetical protein
MTMPLPDIPLPMKPTVLKVGDPPTDRRYAPSPHIYIFTVPQSPWYCFWEPVQLSFTIQGDGPTNLGIYGVDPPVISGKYGLARFPKVGDADSYIGTRSIKAGTCYAVVRFDGPIVPHYTISIAKV